MSEFKVSYEKMFSGILTKYRGEQYTFVFYNSIEIVIERKLFEILRTIFIILECIPAFVPFPDGSIKINNLFCFTIFFSIFLYGRAAHIQRFTIEPEKKKLTITAL